MSCWAASAGASFPNAAIPVESMGGIGMTRSTHRIARARLIAVLATACLAGLDNELGRRQQAFEMLPMMETLNENCTEVALFHFPLA